MGKKQEEIWAKLDDIKNKFSNNVNHSQFSHDDICFNKLGDQLGFTYSNLFFKVSAKFYYIKKEIIEEFDLIKFVLDTTKYDAKVPGDYINIDATEEFFNIFYSLATDIFLYYINTIETFGCCSHFTECSDNLCCVYKNNKEMYFGCLYRKNLEEGRIFYGKNANSPTKKNRL